LQQLHRLLLWTEIALIKRFLRWVFSFYPGITPGILHLRSWKSTGEIQNYANIIRAGAALLENGHTIKKTNWICM
jgi:hypothetical protein